MRKKAATKKTSSAKKRRAPAAAENLATWRYCLNEAVRKLEAGITLYKGRQQVPQTMAEVEQVLLQLLAARNFENFLAANPKRAAK